MSYVPSGAFQVVPMVKKNSPAKAGDIRDSGSIPRSEDPLKKREGNPFQYSYLKNPMDRGVQQATVHRVAKNQTQLKRLCIAHSTHFSSVSFFA